SLTTEFFKTHPLNLASRDCWDPCALGRREWRRLSRRRHKDRFSSLLGNWREEPSLRHLLPYAAGRGQTTHGIVVGMGVGNGVVNPSRYQIWIATRRGSPQSSLTRVE